MEHLARPNLARTSGSRQEVEVDLPTSLDAIPRGPKVPDHWVTDVLIDACAQLYGRRPEAEQLLWRATRMRLESDPDATYIKAGQLPDIAGGADAYWHEVFYQASRHGPRMVAAILLTVAHEAFPPEARRDRARLLRFLMVPKAH